MALRERYAAVVHRLIAPGTVVAVPTVPDPAPRRDAPAGVLSEFRRRVMPFTSPAGLAGLPQVAIPAGWADDAPVALNEARTSGQQGGLPIGAALAIGEDVIAAGHNRRIQDGDPIAHGETDCLRRAGLRDDHGRMTLYTTLAPCPMCAGAVLFTGIRHVVIGDAATFRDDGALASLRESGVQVDVLDDRQAQDLMQTFIARHPALWAQDSGP